MQVGQSPIGLRELPAQPGPATYRLVYDVNRAAAAGGRPRPHVHTDWTFTSAERPPTRCRRAGPAAARAAAAAAARAPARDAGGRAAAAVSSRCCSPGYRDPGRRRRRGPRRRPRDRRRRPSRISAGAATPRSTLVLGAGVLRRRGVRGRPFRPTARWRWRVPAGPTRQPPLDADRRLRRHCASMAADAAGSAIDQTITRAYPLAVTAPAQLPTGPARRTQRAPARPRARRRYPQCMAIVNTAAGILARPANRLRAAPTSSPAYRLRPAPGAGKTVAIVDAYDDPNAEADLATYRAHYGLPPCTDRQRLLPQGQPERPSTPLPAPDPGWGRGDLP